MDKGKDVPLNVVSENIRKIYDYYQNILIKEDITKLKSNEDNIMYIKIGIGIFVFF
jgi:hypothetical protein